MTDHSKKLEDYRFEVRGDRDESTGELQGFDIVDTESGEDFVGLEGIYGYQDPRVVQLMASSPKLLEALKYARRFLKKEDVDTDFIDEAINEATTVKISTESDG